jgi:predicted DNA-binding ribbon-helix-helix protein
MAGKGGARPGSGRKPKRISTIAKNLPRATAAMILSEINESGEWLRLLRSSDLKLRFDVLRYLTDRRDGKPSQQWKLSDADGSPLVPALQIRFVNPDGTTADS